MTVSQSVFGGVLLRLSCIDLIRNNWQSFLCFSRYIFFRICYRTFIYTEVCDFILSKCKSKNVQINRMLPSHEVQCYFLVGFLWRQMALHFECVRYRVIYLCVLDIDATKGWDTREMGYPDVRQNMNINICAKIHFNAACCIYCSRLFVLRQMSTDFFLLFRLPSGKRESIGIGPKIKFAWKSFTLILSI